MKTYQFLVECVFISLPASEGGKFPYGYFATISVQSFNPVSAAKSLPNLIRKRMTMHGVNCGNFGLRRTQCRIDSFWQLLDDDLNEGNTESGFSFFKIGPFLTPIKIIKFWSIGKLKPHMLVHLST